MSPQRYEEALALVVVGLGLLALVVFALVTATIVIAFRRRQRRRARALSPRRREELRDLARHVLDDGTPWADLDHRTLADGVLELLEATDPTPPPPNGERLVG